MDLNSEATLRQMIRTRLASSSLARVDGNVLARKSTGKPCSICGMRISEGDIEQEVIGSSTVFAHQGCYSIWEQESDALARTPHQAVKGPAPLHIDRDDGDGISPQTAEYSVSFGGSKDRVGTVLLGRPQGLGAVIVLLRSLGIAEAEINTGSQVLTDQPYYTIQDVVLTPAVLRRFRV